MPFSLQALWRCSVVCLVAAGAMFSQTVATGGGRGIVKPVTGMPYSAEEVTESVQTLADGTHITQTTQVTKMYRDSAGRTRTEHSFTSPTGMKVPSLVDIVDPVAGFMYSLQAQTRVAHRIPWPPAMHAGQSGNNGVAGALPPPPPPVPPSPGARAETKRETLGTQTIDGISAVGSRTTMTYPVGMMGNDQPISTVTETWMSPELHLRILVKRSDPRMGEQTTQLKNLSQSEPDPALFQIPADYTVDDQSQAAVVH